MKELIQKYIKIYDKKAKEILAIPLYGKSAKEKQTITKKFVVYIQHKRRLVKQMKGGVNK